MKVKLDHIYLFKIIREVDCHQQAGAQCREEGGRGTLPPALDLIRRKKGEEV